MMNIVQRWFAILLWTIVLISFSGEVWHIVTDRYITPFFHVYILLEYLLLLKIFRYLFKEHIRSHIWNILGGSFTLVWLGNVLFGEGIWGFPDYIHALEAFIILVLVFKWFALMLKEKIILYPEKTFEF